MFRRPGPRPRPPQGGPLHPRVRRQLRRAHALMENGDHAQAAQIFSRLATEALDRGRLQVAPRLFLQAGHAYLLGGQLEAGVQHAQRGLELLAEAGRWAILHNAGQRAIGILKETGNPQQAEELEAWLKRTLPEHFEPGQADPSLRHARGKLPAKCPYCGATLRPDEVTWLRPESAQCDYCGSIVTAER